MNEPATEDLLRLDAREWRHHDHERSHGAEACKNITGMNNIPKPLRRRLELTRFRTLHERSAAAFCIASLCLLAWRRRRLCCFYFVCRQRGEHADQVRSSTKLNVSHEVSWRYRAFKLKTFPTQLQVTILPDVQLLRWEKRIEGVNNMLKD